MANGPVQPEGWAPPKGYSNGYRLGNVLFVAGQVAWDEQCRIVGGADFAAQFRQAIRNVRAVLDTAGVSPDRVGRVTVYVTDKDAYIAASREVGAAWRESMGRQFPAMTLVQVAALLEEGAMVEIEATAVVE